MIPTIEKQRKRKLTTTRIKEKLTKRPKEYSEFIYIIEQVGYWNFLPVAFSEQYGVPLRTVQNWTKQYIIEWGIDDVRRYAKPIAQKGLVALKEIGKHTTNPDPKIAIVAAKEFLNGINTFTQALNNLGVSMFEAEQKHNEDPLQRLDKDIQEKIYKALAPMTGNNAGKSAKLQEIEAPKHE